MEGPPSLPPPAAVMVEVVQGRKAASWPLPPTTCTAFEACAASNDVLFICGRGPGGSCARTGRVSGPSQTCGLQRPDIIQPWPNRLGQPACPWAPCLAGTLTFLIGWRRAFCGRAKAPPPQPFAAVRLFPAVAAKTVEISCSRDKLAGTVAGRARRANMKKTRAGQPLPASAFPAKIREVRGAWASCWASRLDFFRARDVLEELCCAGGYICAT